MTVKSVIDSILNDSLGRTAKEITPAKAAMTVLAKRRLIRDVAVQVRPTEPVKQCVHD